MIAADAGEIEFRALGALTVRRADLPVAVGGPKQRMVLALLLANANRVITVDRLIDGVWQEAPPAAARHTLHGYVSELRKVLDGQPAREGSGYVLRVDPDRFDVLQFEALTAEGRRLVADDPVAGSARLAGALALWEGTPYADVSGDGALDTESRRLIDLRLQVVEDRVDADLAAGRHGEVTGELEALARDHPFRERMWGQLMLALYRSGRQAESLRAYRRVREVLADELGIHPSPDLQALEQRILEQDPSLAWTGRSTRAAPSSGSRSIRGYELREVIGQGDFGIVHVAYQPAVGRQVALKIIRPEYANTPVFVHRFEAEAQFVAQLEHPHIVPLYDFWRDPEGAYLVMPFLQGGSLAAALRRGPWNPGPALHLLDQVGAALSHAHRRGILHRDVKPSNVLLDADGNAYLADFGVATRVVDDAGQVFSSSLAYVPPEELRGEMLTAASDVYAFATLCFELFTGVRPTGAGELQPISDVRADLPAGLTDVLRRATADRPGARPDRVEDFLRELRQILGADVIGAAWTVAIGPTSEAPIRNPYKGLRAFQETDAPDFYGRDALIDELLAAVSSHRLVGVVGPSGSGKSSVVRAGLVPALRSGAIDGSRSWLITDMFPGSYPFEELEGALLRVAVDDPGSLMAELRTDDRGLMRVVKRILPTDDSELVLVVDQFEEVFSMVEDTTSRRLLLDALTTLVSDERSRVRVVLTLRADFFDRPLEHPAFGELLREGLVAVTPPNDDALAMAIGRPARGVGLELEPGLAAAIVGDVREQPGGLPLLQYALTELFHRRAGDSLTIAAYEESGGVSAALGRRAEELYQGLPAAGQDAARQLMLRLVSVDEHSDDTRRRVRQSELESLDVDHAALDEIVRQFASYRLLTFDQDPLTRSPTVEVAHEALLRDWDRLRGWIDEQRDGLVLYRRLAAALQEWTAADRADPFLLTGGRLHQFEAWAAETNLSLTADERAFLDRSRAHEGRRRRRRSWLRWGAVLVLGGLAAVAFAQSRAAEREATQATARRLAGEATLALAEDPERGILLGLESVGTSERAGEPVLPESIGALQRAVQTSRLEARLDGGGRTVAASPDGSLLATDTIDVDTLYLSEKVVIWDADSGSRLRTLTGEAPVAEFTGTDAFPHMLAFSPDSGMLAVAYAAAPESGVASTVLWDPHTGEELRRLTVPGSVAWNPVWSPDGRLVAVVSWDGTANTVMVWDADTGRQVTSFQPNFVGEMAVYDESTLAITLGPAGAVGFYDFATGAEVDRLATAGIEPAYLAADPAGHRVVVAGQHESLQVWEVGTRSLLWSRPISSTRTLAVSTDGQTLALSGDEGLVRLLDLDDGAEVASLAGTTAGVYGVVFHPDGDRLVSTGEEGRTRIWDITAGGAPELSAIDVGSGRSHMLEFSPDGREVGAATWDGTFERIDAASGEPLGSIDGVMTDQAVYPIVSPDWRLLASVSADGQATVRDLATSEVLTQLPPCTNPRAFSPDGSALVLDGGWLCLPADAPDEAELRSKVIDTESGEELFDLGEGRVVFRAAFNPGGTFEAGRYLAVNVNTEDLDIYDMASGDLMASFPIFPTLIRFDPTGRYLAAGTLNSRAVVVDLAALVDGATPDNSVVMDTTVAPGVIPAIAINADGVLATGAFDSSVIRLWDIHSGDEVAEVHTDLDGSSPPHLNFSPAGDYLLYPDARQVLRRFYLDTDRLVDLAATRVTRDLTPDECRQYLDSACVQ